jgi:2-polyprenyl-6-methoxyphenol hydroxylase-like FAD-dependent oxidoreductase
MGAEAEKGPRVLAVGAGPTGLLLASELERRGVPCLLIDSLDTPNSWDRATVVHPRSMEIFESLGLEGEFLEKGIKTRGARLHSGGEVLGVLDIELSHATFPFDLGISEEVTESVLTAHLERVGGAVTRSTTLVGLSQGPDGVTATLETNGEQREVTVEWVVGCDGLHSLVRELSGAGFEGTDIEAPWAVFDATIDGWADDFDMAASYLDTPSMIMTPLPGRRWRVYLRPDTWDTDLVEDATELLHRYQPAATYVDIEHPTRFQCHSRVATAFRSDRLLLAGDAAHACSPAEGHGMNTGLQDAYNLGWKLALVCNGLSGPDLLDSYGAERRPVAGRVAESGLASEALQATPEESRAARDQALRQVFSDPDSSHHEAVAAAELDRSYAEGGVVAGDAGHFPAPGDRFPDGVPAHPAGGEPCTLCVLTHHPGHTLLVLGCAKTPTGAVGDVVAALEAEFESSPLVDAVAGFCAQGEAAPLGSINEDVAARLGLDGISVLAIRPDRYVGLRSNGGDIAVVTAYFEALTG